MWRLIMISIVAGVLSAAAAVALAATNLNSSKSNIYRVTYDTAAVSPSQAAALLSELEKIGPADEAKLKTWLPANFKRLGIQGDRIKKISIRKADKASTILILLLGNPADEAAGLAISGEGIQYPRSAPAK